MSLEELWAGKNKVERIEHLDALVKLRRLDVQVNRITVIEGLSTLTELEELYLARNGISQITGLEVSYGDMHMSVLNRTTRHLIETHGRWRVFC